MTYMREHVKQTAYRIDVHAACATCGKSSGHDESAETALGWTETHLAMNDGHAVSVVTTTVASYTSTRMRTRPGRIA